MKSVPIRLALSTFSFFVFLVVVFFFFSSSRSNSFLKANERARKRDGQMIIEMVRAHTVDAVASIIYNQVVMMVGGETR